MGAWDSMHVSCTTLCLYPARTLPLPCPWPAMVCLCLLLLEACNTVACAPAPAPMCRVWPGGLAMTRSLGGSTLPLTCSAQLPCPVPGQLLLEKAGIHAHPFQALLGCMMCMRSFHKADNLWPFMLLTCVWSLSFFVCVCCRRCRIWFHCVW